MNSDSSETGSNTSLRAHHHALLKTPLGIPGSGYTRYAAAMWLFQNGEIGAEELEAYRICSKLDFEDPDQIISKRKSTRL